ncbi:MAG: glyoxalase [Lachnospiraceae bacterium]|jgi:lactoylglutathione lyase|nr:glyoxalase [Lachnospiraceae bacterium]
MKINHIALYVNGLEGMKKFYETYFGGIANSKYYNPKTGLQTYFLTFEDSTKLEIMTRPDIKTQEKALNAAGYIHLAFSTGSKENVDRLTTLLKDSGYRVISGPRTTGDGYYESCVLDPEDNQIEIVE